MCLKESVLFLEEPPLCKNAVERSTLENYDLLSLLAVVSKLFEKLVYNSLVDHLEKMWPLF